MADKQYKDPLNGVTKKLVDNGDGTFSELVSNGGNTSDFRVSFSKAIASGLDTDYFSVIPAIGAGMGVSQASGLLSVTSGTTVNAETLIRSKQSFSGDIILRYGLLLSQRIANQAFFVELVDVLGDALAVVINSATSISVTIPGHTFTSANVGQSMYVGNYTGTGVFISGRYAIASVSGDVINFTVAGFTAGSGTASVFGYNYHHVLYDGTTATSAKYDAQRKGYASGDSTVTINTSAAPGHSGVISQINSVAAFLDHGATGGTVSQRTDRTANLPVDADELYIQIRVVNGAVAPASTTTMSLNYISCVTAEAPIVTLAGTLPQSPNAPLPVAIQGSPAVTAFITSTAALTPGVAAVNLGKAEDAASASGDTGVAILGIRIPTTPAAQTSAAADYGAMAIDQEGKTVIAPYAGMEVSWQGVPITLSTTSSTALKTAAAAGIRNFLTDIDIANTSATGVRVDILDGATVIRSFWVPPTSTISRTFSMPLRGTAATALNIQLSAAVTDVRVSGNGYLGV